MPEIAPLTLTLTPHDAPAHPSIVATALDTVLQAGDRGLGIAGDGVELVAQFLFVERPARGDVGPDRGDLLRHLRDRIGDLVLQRGHLVFQAVDQGLQRHGLRRHLERWRRDAGRGVRPSHPLGIDRLHSQRQRGKADHDGKAVALRLIDVLPADAAVI